MKKTNACIKLIAAILVIALTAVLFTGCNQSDEVLMSFEKDGKTYTITESEFRLFLTVRKRLIFQNLLKTTSGDTATFWTGDSSEEGKSNEQYYMDLTLEQVKSALVEKYLFESLGLSLTKDHKTDIKTAELSIGGKGAYKQYYGYKATDYYNIYEPMVERSDLLLETLTKENAMLDATAEDIDNYYKEHFVGYQYIVIDLVNKVVRDEEGNRVVAKEKDAAGNEVDGDTYKTEKLTDEEKTEKQNLAKSILDELAKEDGKSFEELIKEFSDEYYSVEYSEGWFIDKEGTLVNSTVTSKIKDLEIGEHTAEAIESGNYRYIVKRVDLKDKVYEQNDENKYAELFKGFDKTVEYDKYEQYVKSFYGEIKSEDAIIATYSLQKTFLSPYVDQYYQDILYYYYGIS